MESENIKQRRISTNGIHLNIAEQGDGPLVLMLHGFPESWYSWRHQFEPLAKAGYHAVAPDMRGYGMSDKPQEISAYNQVEVTKDIIGLIPALGYKTAVVLGHDWGAPTAWNCALLHPEQVTAVGALSVPFTPRSEHPPLDILKAIYKDAFFYQLYFQEPGVAEAEFERDIPLALRKFLYMATGDVDPAVFRNKSVDSDLLSDLPDFPHLPAWLTEVDLQFYINQFTQSGFRGPLNYYRNLNLTWELTEGAPVVIKQPAMFVAGEKDGVIAFMSAALEEMPKRVLDFRLNQLLPGVGHWTQQEASEQVNTLILQFLEETAAGKPTSS